MPPALKRRHAAALHIASGMNGRVLPVRWPSLAPRWGECSRARQRAEAPLKITRTWGENTQAIYCVDDYLMFHRASFLKCVREYVQGKSKPEGIIDYPIDERAVVAGHNLAQEQLEKLEKIVGKEKLIQRLKDEGYGEEERK